MANEPEEEYKPNLRYIRKVPFLSFAWFKPENIEQTLDYVPKDGDIIITSYPKTGTTWLQYIVLQVTSMGNLFPCLDEATYKTVPFMEITGTEVVDNLQNPRIYNHHISYDMVPKNHKAKYLYIYRNVEDTLVSYYHFMQSIGGCSINFNSFFEKFLTGEVGYGSYFDHVMSFFAHKDDSNLLLISYEKLSRNRKEEILRIARFIDEKYADSLLEDDAILQSIIERTSFNYMKNNLKLTNPGDYLGKKAEVSSKPDKKVLFFRKGIVGDGKNTLSEEQRERLRKAIIEKMKGTELIEEWLQ